MQLKPPETSGNPQKPPETSSENPRKLWKPRETPGNLRKHMEPMGTLPCIKALCRPKCVESSPKAVWNKKHDQIQDIRKVKTETANNYIEAEAAAYELLVAALPQRARAELTWADSNVSIHPFRMNEKVIPNPLRFLGPPVLNLVLEF